MKLDTVFTKTEKGREEIRTRAAGLPQPLRILLIATDGEKDVAKLSRLHPAGAGVAALLAELAALGLIESNFAARRAATESRFARASTASIGVAPKYVMSLR